MNKDVLDEKDMLELFNYICTDDKENEDDVDLKMDDLRKKRLRKNLLNKIKDNKITKKIKYKAAAVAAITIISIGAAVPALAKNVPAIKSIIQALNDKNNDHGVYEMAKSRKIFKPNTIIRFPDATINVEEVRFTPINTYVKITGRYTKEEYKDDAKRNQAFNQHTMAEGSMVYTQWAILDDDGYEIKEEGQQALVGSNAGNSYSSDFGIEYTLSALKHIPKRLTVIPYRDIPNISGGEGTRLICKDINGVYPIELPQDKMGKVIIKEIKTEKDKTTVRYTAEGEAPFYQAKFLDIIDDKGESVEEKSKDFIGKRDVNNPNGYIKEFAPLDKNKKYKIVTHGLDGHIEVRNDLKFTIDLNN